MTKRILSVIIVIAILMLCLLAATSCGLFKKQHVHDHKSTTTQPTCTEAGVVTYTCECGDTYTEAGAAALGHDMVDRDGKAGSCTEAGYDAYQECTRCGHSTKTEDTAFAHDYAVESITYPTYDEDGERTLKCTACGKTDTQKISANGKVLPQISKIIGAFLGEIKISAKANEIVVINGYAADHNMEGYNRLNFVAVKLGEISLQANEGSPVGFFKLELLNYDHEGVDYETDFEAVEPDYERLGDIYVYINGDVISYEIINTDMTKQGDEIVISEVFYQWLAAQMGLDSDSFNKLCYLVGEFSTISDDVLNLVKAVMTVELPGATEEYGEALNNLIVAISGSIVEEKILDNGNREYTTNVEALQALLDHLEGYTPASYLDKVMGEGTAQKLVDFTKSLPSMKVKEIANFAITFAEESGMSTDAVFSYVDLVIFVTSGEKVSIEALIAEQYDKTLTAVIGADEETLTSNINSVVETLTTVSIEELLGVDFDDVRDLLKQIDDVAYVTYVLDAEGYFVSMRLDYGEMLVVEVSETAFSAVIKSTAKGIEGNLLELEGVIENGEIVSFTLDVNRVESDYIGGIIDGTAQLPDAGYDEYEPISEPEEPTYELVDVFEATYENGTLIITADGVTLTIATTEAEGSFDLEISGVVGEEELLNAKLSYVEKYTDDLLDAELTVEVAAQGLDIIGFSATVEGGVLTEAILVVNSIDEETEWVDGYFATEWVDGHYEEIYTPVFDEFGDVYYIYEEVWVDGEYREVWYDGYNEGTGEYYIYGTFAFKYTNVDGVLTLQAGDDEQVYITLIAKQDEDGMYTLAVEIEEGPDFTLGAKQEGDGVRLVFELPGYEYKGESKYYDSGIDENGEYYENYVPYNYRKYNAILFDLYIEIK